jgi:hypothetical protein
MEKTIKVTAMLILFGLTFIHQLGCGSESTTNTNQSGTTTENGYNSATNYGDVIKFKIVTTALSDGTNGFNYEWSNQSMNLNGNGTLTLSSNPNLTGVYETNDGKYVIELPNKTYISSLNYGRTQSNLSFGITSKQNLNNTSIQGDYIWINYQEDTVESIGGYRINPNGTVTWGLAPYDIISITNFNYFEGGGSGTWSISPTDSSRIIFTENGIEYIGSIYPEKYMLISNGTANGITVGVLYPSSPLSISQIAGTYRGFDFTADGNIGVGRYTVPQTVSPINYYYSYSNPPLISQGNSSGNIDRHPGINNCFVCNDAVPNQYDYTTFCIVLSGECMLTFSRSNTTHGASSCGFGLKIN